MNIPNSISLVLGGGGARGLAHIGVLKVLAKNSIPISSIFGCSMGGLIASLFAIGMDILEIENIARKYTTIRELIKLVDITPHRRGIIVSQRLKGFFSQFIDENLLIEKVRIPLYMNAVDLITGEEVVFDHGNLLDAVISTTAVPGLFSPVDTVKGRLLADGGVINNLPVSTMRRFSQSPIVAVDVHHSFPNPQSPLHKGSISVIPEFFSDFYRAEMIMVRKIMDIQLAENPPDLLIRPAIDPGINMFLGFQRSEELILSGEKAAHENIEKIHKLINHATS
jgi:NTE family protein